MEPRYYVRGLDWQRATRVSGQPKNTVTLFIKDNESPGQGARWAKIKVDQVLERDDQTFVVGALVYKANEYPCLIVSTPAGKADWWKQFSHCYIFYSFEELETFLEQMGLNLPLDSPPPVAEG